MQSKVEVPDVPAITMDTYQRQAMTTCMDSCRNDVYMLTGLSAEVGELFDKIAKLKRAGKLKVIDDDIVFTTSDISVKTELLRQFQNEIGDILWFVSGVSSMLGLSLNEVAFSNLRKLQMRKKSGTIETHTDH